MDRDTKIKVYGLAVMAAIYPAFWLIGFINDWWHVIPSWMLQIVGWFVAFCIFIRFGLGWTLNSDNDVQKYIGIGICIACGLLVLYYVDFSGGGYSERCYAWRGSCI